MNLAVARFRTLVLSALVLLMLVSLTWLFVSYARQYFFLFDDFALIELARTHSTRQLLAEPLTGFYRPLPFLLLRAETLLFGWDYPAGYLALNLICHALNAMLCAWLASLLLPRRPLVAILTFTLVLASPWATETFLWASGIFDLFAAIGVLTALIGVRLTVQLDSTHRAIGVAMAGAGAIFAVFSKENAVILPALAIAVVLIDRPWFALWRPATRLALIACSVPIALYLLLRAAVLGMLAGGYGEFGTLWHQAPVMENILRYARAFVWAPMPATGDPLRLIAVALLATFVLRTLIVSRGRLFLGIIAAFLIATLPVCWFALSADSTAAGRYAYLPGMLAAIALASGLAMGESLVRVIPIVSVMAYAGASLLYQVGVWSASCDLSRSVLAQLEPYRGRTDLALDIQNLPYMFVEGPYILKAYTFRFYGDDREAPLPPIKARARTVAFASKHRPHEASAGIEAGSDYFDQPPAGLREESIQLEIRSYASVARLM